MRRVVVTGLGLVTPLGGDVETSWSNILAGKSGAGRLTRFDASSDDYTCKIACEVKNGDGLHRDAGVRSLEHDRADTCRCSEATVSAAWAYDLQELRKDG